MRRTDRLPALFAYLPWAIVIVVTSVAASSWLSAERHELAQSQARTSLVAEDIANRLQTRFEVNLGLLRMLKTAWEHGHIQTPEDFFHHALDVRHTIGQVLAIDWIDIDGSIRWADPERPEEGDAGPDVAADPVALAACAEARRTGEIRVTPPIGAGRDQKVVVAYLPLSRAGAPSSGCVAGTFRVEPLASDCFPAARRSRYGLSLHDGDATLFLAGDQSALTAAAGAARTEARMGDRTWQVTLTPAVAAAATRFTSADEIVAIFAGLLGVGIAILVRRLAVSRQQLRASDSELRLLTDSLPACISIIDQDLRYSFNNAAYETWFGIPREKFRGTHVRELLGPEAFEIVQPYVRDALAGRPVTFDEHIDNTIHGPRDAVTMLVPRRDSLGAVAGVYCLVTDVTDQKQAERELVKSRQTERLLLKELNHRVRNNLSSLITLIDMTSGNDHDTATFAAAIRGRVRTMATVHSLLSSSKWERIGLRELVHSLLPDRPPGAIAIEGDDVTISSERANALAMVLHELMMNGVKHGALGTEGGSTVVSWSVENDRGDNETHVVVHWREAGGPPIETEPIPRIGTSLIEGLVRSDLCGSATLRYPRSGVDHEFTFSVQRGSDHDDAPAPARPDVAQPQPATA